MSDQRLRILTWHVHGSYLYYLAQCRHDFFVPAKPGRPDGYAGRSGTLPWPENLHEVPAEAVRRLDLDCVLCQSRRNWLEDRFEILSPEQQRLPAIYLEHDPPRESPTDTRHPVNDPGVLLVHVTHFNNLMWDPGRTPTRVIEHGVIVPEKVTYDGGLARGLVVVNNMASRGRRLGADVFEQARRRVPLDLIGMGSERLGGLGEVRMLHGLAEFEARYRFFFNPIRWTSLGLAVCEAMMIGLPIVGLATTEMVRTVENGVSGFLDTDPDALIGRMRDLLDDPGLARRMGEAARRTARERFDIRRFTRDWDDAFRLVTGVAAAGASPDAGDASDPAITAEALS